MSPPSPWQRWVRLLEEREAGTSLALFRMAVGASLLYNILSVVTADLVVPLWTAAAHGGMRAYGPLPWLVELLGGATPQTAWLLTGAMILGGLQLVLGLLPRAGALLALQAHLALTWLNGHAGGSYDDLLSNALFILLLTPSARTLSVQCRLRRGSWTSDATLPSWPRWLAVGQLVLMYASTGAHKLSSHWVPGGEMSALYYILQQPTWQRWDMAAAAWVYPLTQVATLLTWCFEVGSPLLLLAFWFRRSRTRPGRLRALFNRVDLRVPYALYGLALHLGIQVLMDVGPFSAISLSFYLCLVHPDEWRALWRRARRGGPSPSASPARRGG